MDNKKITFFEYTILKLIIAGLFLLLYFNPSVFCIFEDTMPDAIIYCKAASLFFAILTISKLFDAIYKASLNK